MESLYFVKICSEYANYLKKYEDKIREKGNRPYIGILLKVDEKCYVAPLSSPKEKYEKMKEDIDIFKIKKGKLGVINFNNMMPVYLDKKYLNRINLKKLRKIRNEKDRKYFFLLKEQLKICNENREKILKKAEKLYEIFTKDEMNITRRQKFIKNRVVNFKLLEKLCDEYVNYLKLLEIR